MVIFDVHIERTDSKKVDLRKPKAGMIHRINEESKQLDMIEFQRDFQPAHNNGFV